MKETNLTCTITTVWRYALQRLWSHGLNQGGIIIQHWKFGEYSNFALPPQQNLTNSTTMHANVKLPLIKFEVALVKVLGERKWHLHGNQISLANLALSGALKGAVESQVVSVDGPNVHLV